MNALVLVMVGGFAVFAGAAWWRRARLEAEVASLRASLAAMALRAVEDASLIRALKDANAEKDAALSCVMRDSVAPVAIGSSPVTLH